MALRVKDKRNHHSNQDLLTSPRIHSDRRKGSQKNSPRREYLPPVTGYASAGQPKSSRVFEPHAQHKTQVIVVGCQKHPEEMLKFIDVSTSLFGTHCEVCIVGANSDLRQMKLERISDIHGRITKMLKSHAEQLQALETKVDSMTKEIKINSVLLHPVMTKIDFMEKQSMLQVENLFKKLRQKFTKLNPFKNTKDEIINKLDSINEKLEDLSYPDGEALEVLRNLLKNEAKMKEDAKSYLINIKTRLETSKVNEKPTERELGLMENAFEEFFSTLTKSCDKFAHNMAK